MTTAWYIPTSFSPIPVGKSSAGAPGSDKEDADEEEDTGGILESVEYICKLIDDQIHKGVAPERIVLGGFSQGCAISLVTGLSSRYAGKLAGIVGLSGYLPLKRRIQREQQALGDERKDTKIFLAHGTRDKLVPVRIFRDDKLRIEKMVGEGSVEAHEYEGMGHVTSGLELRDVCSFLEGVVPG